MPKHLAYAERNEQWLIRTPNEAYYQDEDYQKAVDAYHHLWGFGFRKRWIEMRIVSQFSAKKYRNAWWQQPYFMEHIFWVYQQLEIDKTIPNQPHTLYYLEYSEAQRVAFILYKETGRWPFPMEYPLLELPSECCQLTQEETKQGVSEHIRHRPEVVKSSLEIEVEKAQEEEVAEITKSIKEIEFKSDESDQWNIR